MIAPAVPDGFDVPLAGHHRLIGRWVAEHAPNAELLTRGETRRRIERTFAQAVADAIGPCGLADLRAFVFEGASDRPPAIAIVCDSIGQIDLGWIEKTNTLSHTLRGSVAPVAWRARAYRALASTLPDVLPVFGYEDMIEELSGYYWDGETNDEAARHAMVTYFGADPDDLTLPSDVAAKRPDFMLPENAGPFKSLPRPLQARLRRLHAAHAAVAALADEDSAWRGDMEEIAEYVPEYEECAYLPPMTIVSVDHFAQEVDEVGRMGMETRFRDIAGLCPLSEPRHVATWFRSLRLGGELLAAAEALISIDPTKEQP